MVHTHESENISIEVIQYRNVCINLIEFIDFRINNFHLDVCRPQICCGAAEPCKISHSFYAFIIHNFFLAQILSCLSVKIRSHAQNTSGLSFPHKAKSSFYRHLEPANTSTTYSVTLSLKSIPFLCLF